jgi:hypothetical protein
LALRACLRVLIGFGLALAICARAEAADCVSAGAAGPYDKHDTVAVENRCPTPIAISICWRWPGYAESHTYQLSRAGSVTFVGPEGAPAGAASPTWQYCAASNCPIVCTALPTAPASTPAALTPPHWGALAAGIEPAGTDGHVGVGWAVADGEKEAQDAALGQCRKQGVSTCRIVTIYNEGCGYVTTGSDGHGAYGWGTGRSPERAVANCASQGFACQKPIGGCVN